MRELDLESELAKIPAVPVEKRLDNTYWYLVKSGKKAPKLLLGKEEQNKK